MRSYYIYICLLFTLFSEGFAFEGSQDLERTSRQVKLYWENNNLEVSITDTWENKGKELQYITPRQPLPSTANNINFYIDAEGKDFEVLFGKDQHNYLSDLVGAKKDPYYFSFGSRGFPKILATDPIEIVPRESVKIKYKWDQSLNTVNDFENFNLFLADRVETSFFDISLTYEGTLTHFFPYFSLKGSTLYEENTLVWQATGENVKSNKNFKFFISKLPQANLFYQRANFLYQAHFFKPIKNTDETKNILVLIDQSGSMYGSRWNRIKTIIPDVLKVIGSNQNIKIGLFDDQWNFLNEEFEKNTHQQQKFWIEEISPIIPTGKSDWEGFFSFLSNLDNSERVDKVLVFGDFSDTSIPENLEFWKDFSKPMFFLDFGKNNFLNSWLSLFFGAYLPLYQSPFDFVEQREFIKHWEYLGQENKAKDWIKDPIKNSNTRPEDRRNQSESIVFLSREDKNEVLINNSEEVDFLPSWWGRHQVGFHLRYFLENDRFLKGALEAISSLNNYFNLELRDSLLEDFKEKNYWKSLLEIQSLESSAPLFQNSKIWKGMPVYGEEILSPLNFGEKIDSITSKVLRIKPFSPAYYRLYKDFPEKLGEAFSWNEEVAFCTEFRCLEIIDSGESLPNFSHRLFWDKPFGQHWADKYIEQLAIKNIFKVEINADLGLGEDITRGEFMSWVAQYLYEEDLKNLILPQDPVFKDLPVEEMEVRSLTLLKQKGIIKGFSDGTVRPEKILFRAEAVKILLALKGYEPKVADYFFGDIKPFKDLVGWEIPWVLEAYEESIIQGYGDRTFRPFNPLNKAEASKILIETLSK